MAERQKSERSGDAPETSASDAVLIRTEAERAREMYRRFLESEYPDALAMAEDVLRLQPDDVMALAIRAECQAALGKPETVPAPAPPVNAATDSEMPTSVAFGEGAEEITPAYAAFTASAGEPSREMCRRFLESDHPAALALAESVLEANPNDRMARAIAEQCRAALERSSSPPPRSDDDTQIELRPPSSPRR